MVFRTASFCKSRSRQRSLSPPFPSFSLTGRRKRKGRLSWRQRISKGALNLRHRSCQHGPAGDFEGPVRKPAPLSIIFRSAALCVTGRLGGEYPTSCFHTEWEDDMPESVYDVILLIGSSKESWEKAAANAVEQASKSLRNLRVAEIVELDMQLDAKGKVEAYRAKVRLSFKVER